MVSGTCYERGRALTWRVLNVFVNSAFRVTRRQVNLTTDHSSNGLTSACARLRPTGTELDDRFDGDFYRASAQPYYASAVIVTTNPSVHLSFCLSVTRCYCVAKTTFSRINLPITDSRKSRVFQVVFIQNV